MSKNYTQRNPPRPVTILLGFTCKDGITLACDSQLSFTGETHKQMGVSKLARVQFANGSVLIAKAGSTLLADYFQELFELKAASVSIDGPRTVADLAEKTMKETVARLIDALLPQQPNGEAIQQHVINYNYVVMLAYYYAGEPRIFVLPSYAGLAIKQTHSFTAAGCGENLASYVMTGIDTAKLTASHAMALASYAVEVCKNHDAGCGGDTQVGFISKNAGECTILTKQDAVAYANAAFVVSSNTQKQLLKSVTETFDAHAFLYFNEDGSKRVRST